jgi:hypothetical protein
MAVPNIFGNVTTTIPLSQLDQNFATAVVLGNTSVYLGNTVTAAGNLTLNNSTLTTPTLGVASATSINFGQTALSYYGEGTWTPTDVSGASLSFSVALGTYTRVGRMFMAGFSVTYPVTASGANADIGAVPFTVANSATARTGLVSFSATATPLIYCAPTQNTTDFLFINSAGAIATNANLSGTNVRGAIISYV